jgi:transcriptional regulator with XRE-family HTH domain
MTLGEQLKKLRADKGVSQPELAELAGIEQSYLSKLENDKSLPSNEVFRKLLNAFSVSVAQLLEPLDTHYIKSNLLVISDIKQLYQQVNTKQLNQQRNLLYIASALIVLAVTLFYIGYAKQVFNEIRHEYSSDGVILAGEPNNVFGRWRDLIDSSDSKKHREKLMTKKIHMAQRSDVLVQLTAENKGTYFEESVDGGRRLFQKSQNTLAINVPQPVNGWLQVLGVLLFSSGIMMFVLERRLFKLNT